MKGWSVVCTIRSKSPACEKNVLLPFLIAGGERRPGREGAKMRKKTKECERASERARGSVVLKPIYTTQKEKKKQLQFPRLLPPSRSFILGQKRAVTRLVEAEASKRRQAARCLALSLCHFACHGDDDGRRQWRVDWRVQEQHRDDGDDMEHSSLRPSRRSLSCCFCRSEQRPRRHQPTRLRPQIARRCR